MARHPPYSLTSFTTYRERLSLREMAAELIIITLNT